MSFLVSQVLIDVSMLRLRIVVEPATVVLMAPTSNTIIIIITTAISHISIVIRVIVAVRLSLGLIRCPATMIQVLLNGFLCHIRFVGQNV